MNRLTTNEEYPHGAEGVSEDKLTGKWCRGKFECTAIVERLSRYENTGLSPEQILELKEGRVNGILREIEQKILMEFQKQSDECLEIKVWHPGRRYYNGQLEALTKVFKMVHEFID